MARSSHLPAIQRLIAPSVMVALCIVSAALGAEEPEINVAVSTQEIFAGESVDYQVEIRNTKNPPAPDLSAIRQTFDVVVKDNESRNESSTFIINGRVTQQNIFRHVYHYQLTPKTTGNLKIPPVTATIDGKTLTSDQIPLSVAAAEAQDLVLVEIEANHLRVYPTQPFTIMLRVLVQPLPNDADRDPLTPLRRQPPHVQISWAETPKGLSADETTQWLQPLLAEDGVGFTLNNLTSRTGSFFDGSRAAVFNFLNGREVRAGIDGRKIRYFLYEISRTFTPEKTGTYAFGPALVKGTFVAAFERNEYKGRRLVTSAPTVSVEVREVPSSRPATFCGGIGEYTVAASASPTKLRVGDPLTLTVELQRGSQSGSLELISAPDLSAIPELAADFELIDSHPTGRIEGAVKKFAYAMRPKRSGVHIPSLTISTFDPQTEQFVNVETAAIPMQVAEASHLTGGDLVGIRNSADAIANKTKAEGIFHNIADPSEVRDERISLLAWTKAVLVVWCVTGCLIAIVTVYRRKYSDARWVRRQQARRTANRRFAEAKTLMVRGESIEALQQIRSAIIGLVADTRNGIAEGMTTADVITAMASASVPTKDISATSQLLESIESAAYGAADSANTGNVIAIATELMARVAPYLERGA